MACKEQPSLREYISISSGRGVKLADELSKKNDFRKLLSIESSPTKAKMDYSAILEDAFNSIKSVKIRYKGSWRTIDPYSFNKTYIVAYCHLARDIRTFRIDRIQEAELSESFNFDKSLQITARARLVEAPSYKAHSYRSRY